ncbi:MAG: protein arginine kinase [Planctomycetota bacterium]|jgi:protein arginine kinase
MEFATHGPWLSDDGPHTDVVMSCRVRLARNIAGFPFVGKANDTQRRELLNIARQVVLGTDLAEGMIWVDLGKATARDRQLLVERHLISRNLAEASFARAVAVSGDETLSIMVNEEDHLRMQLLAPGQRLIELVERINAIDDTIETRVDYAFSPRFGYLTACPTNVGTGIRLSVMMHLPALKLSGEIDRVRRAAKDLHLAVRGFYGEGSDSAGDFYQISNQVTLGRSEQDILDEFQQRIVPRIVDYEQRARQILVNRNTTLLDDRIHRALGILQGARLLGAEEAMKLLSRLRLGVHLGRLPDVDIGAINRLLLQIQTAHLQLHVGAELNPDQRREARAKLVRQVLM